MPQAAEAQVSLQPQAAIVEHGEVAPSFAHRRAAERLRKADTDSAHHWCVVSRAKPIVSHRSRERH
jgi:hypothetical protein